MSNTYQKKILLKLITKYEKSRKKDIDTSSWCSIPILKIEPKYDDYDALILREKIEVAIYEIKNFIKVNRDDDDDIINITLKNDMCSQVYNYLGLKSKDEINSEYQLIFEKYSNTILKNFIKEQNHKFKSPSIAYDILKTMEYVLTNKSEISLRSLSIKLFSDSKRILSMKDSVESLLIKHFDKSFDDCLVVINPSYITFKGDIIISCNDQIIDLSKINNEITLSLNQIKSTKIVKINFENVLTVENLTSFHDVNLENTLIIYIGGFQNSACNMFINMLHKKLNFYHFGDIDIGGFKIYYNLKKQTNKDFKTVKMGITELEKYREFTKKLTKNDVISLKSIEKNEVLKYIEENNVKLEQEIIVINDLS